MGAGTRRVRDGVAVTGDWVIVLIFKSLLRAPARADKVKGGRPVLAWWAAPTNCGDTGGYMAHLLGKVDTVKSVKQ